VSSGADHSFANGAICGGAGHNGASRTFIAFSSEALAIVASVCFHDVANASTEEVHMKKAHSTNRLMLLLCALAAAGTHALLD
jgi:hypothetical protein